MEGSTTSQPTTLEQRQALKAVLDDKSQLSKAMYASLKVRCAHRSVSVNSALRRVPGQP